MAANVWFTFPSPPLGGGIARVPTTFMAWGGYKRIIGGGTDPNIVCNLCKFNDTSTVLATGTMNLDGCSNRNDALSTVDPQWRAQFNNLTLSTGVNYTLHVGYQVGGTETSGQNINITLDNTVIPPKPVCPLPGQFTSPPTLEVALEMPHLAPHHKKTFQVPITGSFDWDPRITACKAIVYQNDPRKYFSLTTGELSLGQYAVLVDAPATTGDGSINIGAYIFLMDAKGKIYLTIDQPIF